jgi:predicted nucleic acid-binding Zn ribbon protein
MARKNKITDIGTLLSDLFESRKWKQNLIRHQIFEFWNEAVGKDISAHAQPKVIRGDVLWVDVTDSVWMQQLHLMKEQLLGVLNKKLGDDGVVDIRFNLTARLKPVLPPKKVNVVKPSTTRPPDPVALARFEKMLSAIADENTRASMKRIWLAQEGRE